MSTLKHLINSLKNFKLRHEIKLKKKYMMRVLQIKGTVKLFQEENMSKPIENYNEDDVFNTYETAQFYKLLPDRLDCFQR